MIIDIKKLNLTNIDYIDVNIDINIDNNKFLNSGIIRLKNAKFEGRISKNIDLGYNIDGNLSGLMILLDDISLKEVEYKFEIEISDNIEKDNNNKLDLEPLLWENIITEIPSKVHSCDDNLNISGNGWRLVSEDMVEDKNYALSNLEDLLKERRK